MTRKFRLYLGSLSFLGLSVLLALGCRKDNDHTIQVDLQEALQIMNDCSNNAMNKKESIEENLVGSWDLMAYGCGFCIPPEYIEASIIFNPGEGDFELISDFEDTTFQFTWEIQFDTFYQQFYISSDPPHYGINSISTFCEDHMFFDHRAFDGAMMLFAKR